MVYLLAVGQYVSEPMFNYFCQFARLFRQAFSESIADVLNAICKDLSAAQKATLAEECRMAPLICDYFLRLHLGLEQR